MSGTITSTAPAWYRASTKRAASASRLNRPSERRLFVACVAVKPFPRFDTVRLAQQPANEDAVNAQLALQPLAAAACRPARGTAAASGQPLPRRDILPPSPACRGDNTRSDSRRAVSEPDPVSSAEHTAHGRDLDLQPPVIVPFPLEAGAPFFISNSPSSRPASSHWRQTP